MLYKRLEENIMQNNIDEVIQILEEVVTENNRSYNEYLMYQLRITENHILRNQIALTLSDLNFQAVVPVIIELLQSPKTEGYRGTLLYSLRPLNYLEYIDTIIELCLRSNLEVKLESLQLIKEVQDKIPKSIQKKYKKIVAEQIAEMKIKKNLLKELKGLIK